MIECKICKNNISNDMFKYPRLKVCRKCSPLNKTMPKNKTTKLSKIRSMYETQKQSSKKRGHSLPEYDFEWFKSWCLRQDMFHYHFNIWINSKIKWDSPSCNRLDNSIGYTKDNIEMINWRENSDKNKSELGNANPKSVSKYDLNGKLLATFSSMLKASQSMRLSSRGSSISNSIKNNNGIFNGYLWKLN